MFGMQFPQCPRNPSRGGGRTPVPGRRTAHGEAWMAKLGRTWPVAGPGTRGSVSMPPPSAHRPLDLLWQPGTLVWVVLAGEALAIVLALAPGVEGGRLAYFGMASFAIQWVFIMSLCLLYLGRHWLGRASPPVIAQGGLAALLVSTWLVIGLARVFLPELGLAPASGWSVFTLQATLMALTVGLLALAA